MRARIIRVIVSLAVLIALVMAYVLAVHWLRSIREAGYLKGVPGRIQVVEAVVSDETDGFREGCGIAVFRVSQTTLDEIQTGGLAFFRGATLGRDNGKYFRYEDWKTTPSGARDSVLRGVTCADLDPVLIAELRSALRMTGSYFTVGYEYDLLLVPSKGLVVFNFNG